MASDEQLLERAIAIAASARAHGNHPFGALLADRTGAILAEAENSVVTGRDVTGHAETNLVREATGRFTAPELATLTLYTSTEPCAMCAGAIYWSGIGAVVYALAESELAAMTGDDPENPTLALPCRSVFAAGRRSVTVTGPFALASGRAVHAGFWNPATSV